MYFPRVESDQLYTWYDKNGKPVCCRLEKTPSSPPTPTATAQGDPAWLADRALQTLWQAGVQMRRRPRPWPQILPFGEPPGLAATNGLCAAGVSRSDYRVPCQLPPGPRDLRIDLRDQPLTAAPPGGALNGHHERSSVRPPCTNRSCLRRRAPPPFPPRLALCQP